MIELMVVLLILSVVVALVVGIGRHIAEEQRRKLTSSHQAIIIAAINIYYDRKGSVPQNPPAYSGLAFNDGTAFGPPAGMTLESEEWKIYARGTLLFDDLNGQSECKVLIKRLPWGAIRQGEVYHPGTFADAYEQYMDYRQRGGIGGSALIVSAGPDGLMDTADDIRSDGRSITVD